MKTITIYRDEQVTDDTGWAYRIAGGASGGIDGDAAEAVTHIVDGTEGADLDALRAEIGHESGDRVEIHGPGLPGDLGDLGDLLDRC